MSLKNVAQLAGSGPSPGRAATPRRASDARAGDHRRRLGRAHAIRSDRGPAPGEAVLEEVRRVLWDVASRGDADLFRQLARCWNVPESDHRELWRAARAQPHPQRTGLVDDAERAWIFEPARLWRGLLQPPIPLSWRERCRIILGWLMALILVAIPIAFFAIALREFATLLPLAR